jgi:ABC-type Zn2+ transport system substrate-binding protein/surface adhesin
LPKKTTSIRDRIKEIYGGLLEHFKKNDKKHRVSFNEFIGQNKEERIISFYPLLQLDSQKKIWLEQEEHLFDFHIWLKEVYFEKNPDPFAELKHEIEEKLEELDDEKKARLEEINKDFENPLGALFD